ncbi:DUF3137 domain-containing protein [Oceanithermus sp.]
MPAKAADPLRAFYRLIPRIRALEAERRKTWVSLAVAWGALVGPGLLLGVWLRSLGGSWQTLLAPPLVGAALAYWLSASLIYPFKYDFKRKVIKPLMAELLSDVEYAPLGSVSALDLEASLLFDRPLAEVSGEDLVIGRSHGVEVKFSEVAAYAPARERRSLARDGIHRNELIFKGLFFVADFNKPARGQVIVRPDAWDSARMALAGLVREGRDAEGLEPVRMEDPRFERYFRVYASDSEVAHYVLTPVLMEELAAFREAVGAPVAFSVVYGKLYMSVATRKNMLEPPLFGPLASPRVFRSYLEYVDMFLSLVERLGLDRRIWGDITWK